MEIQFGTVSLNMRHSNLSMKFPKKEKTIFGEEKETKKEKTRPKKESNDTEPMEESSHGRW